jgi:GNAT superfamily N-acetyltransferase
MSEWTIRSATLGDRDAAIALMDRAYGPSKHRAALWDWAFAHNPYTSDLYYLVADTGTALAAQYAAVPVAMQHEGRPIRGLLSIFTATDPDFQGRGLFRTLAQALYDDVKDTCPLVFGFPNHKSGPVFYTHLGWIELRPFPNLRRPLRNTGEHPAGCWTTALCARALDTLGLIGVDRTVTIGRVDDFTGVADPIWSQLKPRVGTAIVRDETFLNWRFVQSPFAYHRLVATRAGRPVGIAVVATDSEDGKARLMELMVAPGEKPGVTRALLVRVVELATDSGAYGLGFIATRRHPRRKAMIAAGLLPPIRMPPLPPVDEHAGSFGVRVNGPAVTSSRVLHIDDWYLSSADQDWL